MIAGMTESFPRQQARTRWFTLGVPRAFKISPDGARVAFLRSRTGGDPVTCLWILDVATAEERLVADPAAFGAAEEDLPPEERARRERAREQAGGITAYATDTDAKTAVFALSGRVYTADLTGPGAKPVYEVPVRTPALDPRPDPAGQRVAYVSDGALRIADLYGPAPEDRALADPHGEQGVTFGLAEFIAAEEMERFRGYWWSPDGTALLTARVDETPVNRWYIADPANPDKPPAEVAYPAAGTPNADVSLMIAGLDGRHTPVTWDRDKFPYLVTATWEDASPLIVVLTRDQRESRILTVNPATGTTELLRKDTDDKWLDIVPGVPARTSSGHIVWTADADNARRLLVATPDDLASGEAKPVTPADLQVREVLAVDGDTVLFAASKDPAEVHLWTYSQEAGLAQLTTDPGVHSGRAAGGTTLTTTRTLKANGVTVQVLRRDARGENHQAPIKSAAETPDLPAPSPAIIKTGPREIRTAVLFPSWHKPGQAKLPVLLDPYGGPHAQRVLAAAGQYLTSQWFAEQGFAVVIADGRGTPARGPNGARRPGRPRHPRPRRSDRRPARRRRPAHRPRPRQSSHQRLVLRRLPRSARRAAPPRHLPRRSSRRPSNRLAPL